MYYTIKQAANILGIKVRTAREWIRLGKMRAEKDEISRRWKISQQEIERIYSGKEPG